jgi:hypothetical protein
MSPPDAFPGYDDPINSEEECLAIGGHFWELDSRLLLSNPPQNMRTCSHCGKHQKGRVQDPESWRDWS